MRKLVISVLGAALAAIAGVLSQVDWAPIIESLLGP